jgi:hypothetical protein
MADMLDCIATAAKLGEMDATRAEEATRTYTRLRDKYLRYGMGEGEAAARAAADLKEAVSKAATSRFHKVVAQLDAMRRIKALVEDTPDPSLALTGFFRQAEGHGFKGESVQSLTEAYEDMIRARMNAVLTEVGLNVTGGTRNKARLESLIREMHGQASGDATAAKLAKVVQDTQAMLVAEFNRLGGDIKWLKDRGMPQSHDAGQLLKRGFDDWSATISARLDWSRIDNFATGRPFADAPGVVPDAADTGNFLREVYDSITTRGWSDRDPSMTPGGRALYNTRADHRVLHFRSGDDQLAYNREFGASDPFTAMINEMYSMASDLSHMRILGPNPKMGLEFASQVAKKRAADLGDTAMLNRAERQSKKARAIYAHTSGAVNIPENEAWARFLSGTRAVLTSTQLGSAVLSSVTDVATITAAADTIGMSATNTLSRSVKLMASQMDRADAARAGYVAETLADAGGGAARFMGKMFGTGIPERMAGFTLRASGLAFVTDMRKAAFQMEFAGFMAQNANRGFDQIDDGLRRILQSRDITATDWDALRAPEGRFVAQNGADYIAPFWWAEHQTKMPRQQAQDLALRLQMALREQLELAIPSASVEGKAMLQGTAAAGSISGELLRSSTAYKSFSMSLMLGQYRRFMAIPTPMGKAKYAAKLSAMLLTMGALAIQLKELAKGNDPRPMNTGKFWMAATFQSGGLGLFGDFFSAETSRTGDGLGGAILGPVVGLAGDIIGPIADNTGRLIAGDNTSLGRDTANFIRGNTPVMSSMWWARTAYSRLVADELTSFLDPQAETMARRRAQRQRADYGTQPFWEFNENLPSRAPNLMNAFGESQ